MIVFYCNQIGWAALEYEEDPEKLDVALGKMEKGLKYATGRTNTNTLKKPGSVS
jgi:hypothetical protein